MDPPAGSSRTSRTASTLRRLFRREAVARVAQRHGALLALALVFLFATVRYPAFATPENLFNVVRQNSMLGLVALGMTLVILSGGIDLSVGSLVGIGGIAAAALS